MDKVEINKYLKEIDNNVGKRIRCVRLLLGISRSELGRHIGVSLQQIAKYESGANRVSVSRLFLITKKLKKKINYFFELP